jgi:hypothetical protein
VLLAADAKVELVASGFGLNEGATWVRDGKGSGFLLVGGLLDNVGAQTRAGRSHVLLIGPSCSGVDPQGPAN